jgi:hypothetical protein
MRQGARTVITAAFAVVVLSAGAAYGAAGDPLILGQSNSSGAGRTSLSSTATTGSLFAVSGSTSGGVVRAANAGTGSSLVGASTGPGLKAMGVSASSTSSNGVQGVSAAGAASGVYGENDGGGDGVAGRSHDGLGVYGETTNGDAGVYGTGLNIGVKGITSNTSGIGVYGQNTSSGAGVSGTSATGNGVDGAGGANGVNGASTSGTGVNGTSSNGVGVVGTSTTADGTQGNTSSNGASGVYGRNSGTGNGVAGRADNGVGVLGASTNGFAMKASGDVTQNLPYGGWVKAMVFVDSTGTKIRCFNSQETGALVYSNGCNISITRSGACNCIYDVNFHFNMTDRFESATPLTNGDVLAANLMASATSTAVKVKTTNVALSQYAPAPFMLIVY